MKIKITRAGMKTVVNFLVARCVSATIVTLVRQNTDAESDLQAVQLVIGAHVIGELVASGTKQHVEGFIDSIADGMGDAKKQIEAEQSS